MLNSAIVEFKNADKETQKFLYYLSKLQKFIIESYQNGKQNENVSLVIPLKEKNLIKKIEEQLVNFKTNKKIKGNNVIFKINPIFSIVTNKPTFFHFKMLQFMQLPNDQKEISYLVNTLLCDIYKAIINQQSSFKFTADENSIDIFKELLQDVNHEVIDNFKFVINLK